MNAKENSGLKEKYRSPKGFQDIIPPASHLWDCIEASAKKVFESYGYVAIRVPVVEHTEVFTRSIGETTDIVEKEMYTFNDRAGRSLTLRPEGTAPVVRCYVQNGLHTRPSPQKYFYQGPMFRYERPQKGRFRQFYQIGAEAFGIEDPSIDAEMIAMLKDFFSAVGIEDLSFEINSIGCTECRPAFKEALRNFLSSRLSVFCSDCQRRYATNPLRILDCKVPGCIEASSGAPEIVQYLCEACSRHFSEFRGYLDALGIPAKLNPRLVRGLDYYTSTTFEITTTHLGAQKAVAAGGRYNSLVEEFGGPPTPAIGFAIGMERLGELLSRVKTTDEHRPLLFIASMDAESLKRAMIIAHGIRKHGVWCEMNYGAGSLRNLMKKADRVGARFVFIIGAHEIASGRITYRRLDDGREGSLPIGDFDGMAGLLTGKTLEPEAGGPS
ncbi:MAG: histidine--tRNA ligase [bacterium]